MSRKKFFQRTEGAIHLHVSFADTKLDWTVYTEAQYTDSDRVSARVSPEICSWLFLSSEAVT